MSSPRANLIPAEALLYLTRTDPTAEGSLVAEGRSDSGRDDSSLEEIQSDPARDSMDPQRASLERTKSARTQREIAQQASVMSDDNERSTESDDFYKRKGRAKHNRSAHPIGMPPPPRPVEVGRIEMSIVSVNGPIVPVVEEQACVDTVFLDGS